MTRLLPQLIEPRQRELWIVTNYKPTASLRQLHAIHRRLGISSWPTFREPNLFKLTEQPTHPRLSMVRDFGL